MQFWGCKENVNLRRTSEVVVTIRPEDVLILYRYLILHFGGFSFQVALDGRRVSKKLNKESIFVFGLCV